MSKAVFLNAIGGVDGFEWREREDPNPGPGTILVRNRAIGLNFIDIYERKGLYPVSLPAILGQEGAGIVEAVGEGVTSFKHGDRVSYLSGGGAYAELTVASADHAAHIPAGISDDIAAAVFLKGLTVEMLLRQVFPLTAGHSCLIYAASGGVGTLLTQWAHSLGARIIAVVGSEEKAEIARRNGADDVLIRTQTDAIDQKVRALTDGRGVDVVYDSVGKATFESSLNALAMRGHMVTYGNASGPVPAVQPLDLARRGSLTLTRPSLFHYATPDRFPAMAKALFDQLAGGAVKANISRRYGLSDIAEAHRHLESGESAGALILTP